MPLVRVGFDKDNQTEGYEEGSNRNADAPDVRGVYIQNDSSNDTTVVVTRDASNNLAFTDAITGTKTLAQLAAASSGVSYFDFLLNQSPLLDTGAGNDATYTPTYTSGRITAEAWKRVDNTTIKTIVYTYTGTKVSTEVRKVFALDGTTIVAQITWTYVYTGAALSSATMIRNV
jgi:hypothetical protein